MLVWRNLTMEDNITKALEECAVYAENGYKLAQANYEEIHEALVQEELRVLNVEHRQNRMRRIAKAVVLQKLKENLSEFKKMDENLKKDLNILHKNQGEFSIVVFGRTMAGKSTLMEILTHGDGASIGKGAQRTTRDVRDYHWQGMKITDVPGICSFDGRNDDELAMEAAKKADLILFLITDDAPQEDEAEKLAELRNFGKPVLGIINVKTAFKMERKAMSIRDLKKKLEDVTRLNDICNQFKAYSSKYSQDWQGIPFICTHLKAAYIAQANGDIDEEIYYASNFHKVEQYIADKVCNDGCFLRIKTFTDSIVVPMQKRMENLLKHTALNIQEAKIYIEKYNKLVAWRNDFIERVNKSNQKFYDQLIRMIEDEIYDFVEDNYENENIGKDWERHVKSLHIEKKCNEFLHSLAKECDKKRRELTDELQIEIKFSSTKIDTGDITTEGVFDSKMAMQLGAIGISLLLSAPVGIALGVLSLLLDDKDEKIRKQKKELREKLSDAMRPIIGRISDSVVEEINTNILGKGVNTLVDMLDQMSTMLLTLATEEQQSAESLKEKLIKLNSYIWNEAIQYKNITSEYKIHNTARIPGQIFYCIGEGDISIESCNELSKLLGEKTLYITYTEDQLVALFKEWTKGFLWTDIEIGKKSIDILQLISQEGENISNNTNIRLVQQILCTPILN